MLVNIQNHVDVVGWQNIEALELVVHGPVGACQITMKRQQLTREELVEGLTAVPSGVARVMELQEMGYAYIKP